MTRQQVHTKYHKLKGSIITLNLAGHAEEGSHYLDMFKVGPMMTDMGNKARYVLSKDIVNLMKTPKMRQSLSTMIESGLSRLPFPEVLVEYEEEADFIRNDTGESVLGKVRHFVWVSERQEHTKSREQFATAVWQYAEFPGALPFVAMSPFCAACDLITKRTASKYGEFRILNENTQKAFSDPNAHAVGAVFRAVPAFYLNSKISAATLNKWLDDENMIDHAMQPSVQALCALIVMLKTKGVTSDKVTADPKFNAHRQKQGKTVISDYTLVKIGHVYDQSGKAHEYNPSRTMPVHWRAGHWRHQAHGPGRSLRKDIFIDPMLINYEGDNPPTIKPREVIS